MNRVYALVSCNPDPQTPADSGISRITRRGGGYGDFTFLAPVPGRIPGIYGVDYPWGVGDAFISGFFLPVKEADLADSNGFDDPVDIFFYVFNILSILQYLALVAMCYLQNKIIIT